MGRRNLLTIARDLGRLPSELLAIGGPSYGLFLKPDGSGGFVGEMIDLRAPVMVSEFQELIGLYLLEKEEEEEARAGAQGDGHG